MYNTRLEEIRKELEWDDPGKTWHKLAWELLTLVEESRDAMILSQRQLSVVSGFCSVPERNALDALNKILDKLGKKPNDNP